MARGAHTPCQGSLPADPGFVLEPDLQALAGVALGDGGEVPGKVFLKASWAPGSVFGWIGRGTCQDSPISRSTPCMPPRL